jgi:hypothetical protein
LGRQAIGLEEVVEGDQMVHGEASIKCPAITILTSPKKGEEQGRRSEETGEDDGGDSTEVSATPVGTKGATSALHDGLQSPIITSRNRGVQRNLVRKGDIAEETGEQNMARKKSVHIVMSGEDLLESNGQNLYKACSSLSRSVIPKESVGVVMTRILCLWLMERIILQSQGTCMLVNGILLRKRWYGHLWKEMGIC